MKTFRQTSRSATEVQFADPDARFNVLTFKNVVQPKKAGALSVYNAKSSVGYQKTVTLPVDPACTDKCAPSNQEKIAISVNLSGSTASKADVKAAWNDVKTNVDLYIDDLVSGFLPDTAAVITVENEV